MSFKGNFTKVTGKNWQRKTGEEVCADCEHLVLQHFYFLRDDELVRKLCGFNSCPCE